MELYHHGISGQKWGVRRYQNEDGTLTDLGKKRYAIGEKRITRRINSYDKKRSKSEWATMEWKRDAALRNFDKEKMARDILEDPGRVARLGGKTIKQRTVASIAAGGVSTASIIAAVGMESTLPFIGIPASLITAGAYWYKTTK